MDVTNYANNIKYRAFGGVKELTYGSADSSHITYQFDNRLRISSYDATSTVFTSGYVRRATYEYLDDGNAKKVNNLLDSGFDQSYAYDQMGRLKQNSFGQKMNNQNILATTYSQSLQYDAFGNITSRSTDVWDNGSGFTATYQNGRKQNSNEIYDALGNIVDKTTASNVYERWAFDAAGRNTTTANAWHAGAPQQTSYDVTDTAALSFDGDGSTAKRVDTHVSRQIFPDTATTTVKTEYYVRSTVLGKILTELDASGGKKQTNVYTGDGVLAEQQVHPADANHAQPWGETLFKHQDVVTGSYSKVNSIGHSAALYADPPGGAELEPLGGAVPLTDPTTIDDGPDVPSGLRTFKFAGDVNNPESGCAWDGTPINCSHLDFILRSHPGSHLDVDTRTQGGVDAYYSLQGAYKYRTVTRTTNTGVTIPCDGETDGCGTNSGDDGRYYDLVESSSALDGLLDVLIGILKAYNNQSKCDNRLARIFGDSQAVVGSLYDPAMVHGPKYSGGPLLRRDDEDPRNGVIHIYSNALGSSRSIDPGFTGNLYTPPGGTIVSKSDPYPPLKKPTLTYYSNIQVRYAKGALSSYGYNGALIISFIHSGPIDSASRVPTPFKSNITNTMNSVLIGTIGADGSSYDGGGGGGLSDLRYDPDERKWHEDPLTPGYYIHSHVIFYSAPGKHIDPRSVFCKDLGF